MKFNCQFKCFWIALRCDVGPEWRDKGRRGVVGQKSGLSGSDRKERLSFNLFKMFPRGCGGTSKRTNEAKFLLSSFKLCPKNTI